MSDNKNPPTDIEIQDDKLQELVERFPHILQPLSIVDQIKEQYDITFHFVNRNGDLIDFSNAGNITHLVCKGQRKFNMHENKTPERIAFIIDLLKTDENGYEEKATNAFFAVAAPAADSPQLLITFINGEPQDERKSLRMTIKTFGQRALRVVSKKLDIGIPNLFVLISDNENHSKRMKDLMEEGRASIFSQISIGLGMVPGLKKVIENIKSKKKLRLYTHAGSDMCNMTAIFNYYSMNATREG